ncbi:DGC domain protein [Desulfobulbus propionicus DSM 2032]|uniref:DGC domain protein n=1 Tax=Desulfobulbus propionicus (strain ATCC 33891 / DSM 2032 / VKM B-1956 / 1pr3) TaxID=577650 RepID=A0A7U3YL64_DESPD|nr:putative zinc-binding protein [Desulfobulbus propionicus]ADW17418.1 DGC domain protein [Desulfobulbus propionicus DSM 2032]
MSAMQTGCGCSCGGGDAGPKVIFSCSGCADVGELADQAARKLTRDGAGKMACLAGISGKVSGIVKSAEAAQSILAIDGCPLDCTRKTLEIAGFSRVNHLRLSDLGFEKGDTEVSRASIASVISKAMIYL